MPLRCGKGFLKIAVRLKVSLRKKYDKQVDEGERGSKLRFRFRIYWSYWSKCRLNFA